MLLLASVLAGCRRAELAPTALPTPTVTPVSSPLPPVPTAIPPGDEDNPIQIAIVPESSSSSAARAAADALEAALSEETGLTIEVVPVRSGAEALGALCDSVDELVHAAWVDGITYAAAAAEGCGEPMLIVERGTGRNAATGEVVQLLTSAESEITGVGGLSEGTFCRVGFDDPHSWLVPMLMLRAGGLDPLSAFETITDYADEQEVLDALVAGDCDGAGMAQSVYEDLADADTREALNILDESAPIPYAVFMIPPETPLGVRIALGDALVSLEGDDALNDLLDADALVRVEADDLSDVREFVAQSGLDLAQLDN